MPRFTAFVILPILVLLVVPASLRAGEAKAPASGREGWTQVDAVPAWIASPPPRAGYVRLADISQSNGLALAYPDVDTPAAHRNVRLLALARLAPLLARDAHAAAEAAAANPAAIQRAYHFAPAPRGRGHVPGAQVYTAFVLWEIPLASVLAAIPEARRDAAAAALVAAPPGTGSPWTSTTAAPVWVDAPPTAEGHVRVATTHNSGSWELTQALATLRAGSFVAHHIQSRLRPVVGNDAAFEIGVMAGGRRRLLKRERLDGQGRAWQLWDVDIDDILVLVPDSHRRSARSALQGPRPPKPWTWQVVATEPAWTANAPSWPGHIAVVQVRRSDLPELAKQRAQKLGEADVARTLAARLEATLGTALAQHAAEIGAAKRQLVCRSIHDQPPAAGREEIPGARLVTTWSLWQVPVEAILEALPADRHEAASKALH